MLTYKHYSSSRMHFISHNWSATKQRLHPQSVAEISRHSVLSGDRIQQCGTSSGSRYKDNPTEPAPHQSNVHVTDYLRFRHHYEIVYIFSVSFIFVWSNASDARKCSTSTAEVLVPATRRSAIGDRALAVAGPRAWNNLPEPLKPLVLHMPL